MRAALASVALLIALPAQATWRSAQIAGTPIDVDTPDAGVAIVSSGTAAGFATLFSGDSASGLTPQLSMAGDFKSATWRPPSCLIGLLPNATIQFSAGCPTPGITSLAGIAVFAGRVRKQPSGAICAYVWNNTATFLRMQCAGPAAGSAIGDWALLGAGQTPNTEGPMSTLTVPGGAEYLAYGHTIGTLGLYVDGGLVGSFAGSGALRDVALFERGGRPGAIVLTDAGTLTLSLDVVDGGLSPINVPQRPYRTVTFNAAGGSSNGRGFGMLTAGNEIYSPVPNPNALGRDWVRRTEDAGFGANSLVRAICYDPSFCAAITSAGTGQNVFAYFNDSAPQSDLRPAQVAAGGSALYVLDAGDPDGDPIWVTWNDGGFGWDGGDPRFITVLGPPVGPGCGAPPPVAPALIATLSDGLAAHDRQIVIPVTVTGGTGPLPSLVPAPAALAFTAGDLAQSVTASYPADSGCATPALTWSLAPDGGLFGLVPSGAGVSVTPPQVFCRSTPQTFTLTASGASDASVDVPVTVSPWGAPNAPVFQPGTVSQPAGTTVAYAPDASSAHGCDGTSSFPGTELVWFVDGGAPGVTVTTAATQAIVSSSNACVGGTVVLQARRKVTGGVPVQASTAQTLVVQLVADRSPITASTAFDAGFTWNPALSQLAGELSTGASCAADRDLRAEVVVRSSDGGLVNAKGGLAVPGPWSLDLPGGCNGGSFLASASLVDDAGARYGQTATYAFDAGRIAARVPPLLTTEVPVTCGEGARGELELDVRATDCGVQQFSWQQDRGPALALNPDGGARVSFATATQDLQAQAGQELGWSITATVGPGNTAVASRSIRLVPAPFVQLSHRTDVPIAREEEAVGVEVVLLNPTACAVSGLVLRESLGGLQPIPGSVRVGGLKVEATISAGVLEVRELALPALRTTRVSYLARVPLLSRARPSAQVLLAGTDVTVPLVRPVSAGCGCDSTAGSAFGLLLLGAALVRSRRRSV